MPSTSKKQRNFMAAAAHNPEFAKKAGVPVSVAKEFNKADKGKKFKEGGESMKNDIKQDKAMAKKAVGMHESQLHGGKKSNLAKLKKGGAMHKMPDGSMMAGKSHGAAKKYAAGGMPMVEKDGKKVPSFAADGKGKMAKGGACGMKKYAKGGGCELKGKTKGRMI